MCAAPTGEESHELLGGVTHVHVDGEKAAVLGRRHWSDLAAISYFVPDLAVVTYERFDRGHECNNVI